MPVFKCGLIRTAAYTAKLLLMRAAFAIREQRMLKMVWCDSLKWRIPTFGYSPHVVTLPSLHWYHYGFNPRDAANAHIASSVL